MKGNEGTKYIMWTLLETINHTVCATKWDPAGISGLSTVRMVEVKAMLMNAEKKLTKVMVEEGYIYE